MIGLQLIKKFWVLAISPSRLKIDPGRCLESDITLAIIDFGIGYYLHLSTWKNVIFTKPQIETYSKVNDCFISWKCYVVNYKVYLQISLCGYCRCIWLHSFFFNNFFWNKIRLFITIGSIHIFKVRKLYPFISYSVIGDPFIWYI
jgi:hypothetical protein